MYIKYNYIYIYSLNIYTRVFMSIEMCIYEVLRPCI